MTTQGQSIPHYQLYGEEADVRPFDFVHIEPLRDRSELHDWTIDVHTHVGLAQLALFLTGGMELSIDGRTERVRAPAVVTIPSGTVHGFDLDPGSAGFVVMLADERLDSAQLGRWLRSALFERPATLLLDARASTNVEHLCAYLLAEQQTLDEAHDAMTHWLTLVLLTVIARQAESTAEAGGEHADWLRQFRLLVESHFAEHRTVSWYADRLHLSESTLNRLCQRAAGWTAFEIIQDRLELEARRRLRYTTVPVSTLAGELGFADQSYFSRFFRRRTGQSPTAFRQNSTQ